VCAALSPGASADRAQVHLFGSGQSRAYAKDVCARLSRFNGAAYLRAHVSASRAADLALFSVRIIVEAGRPPVVILM
jgi:hypothetical protein